jgi:hypothetical protein
MQRTLLQRLAPWALAAVCLAAMTSAAAAAGSFTRGCAARDMQILKMIEERENTNAASAEKLRDAMLAMMHARVVCHEGYVMDALAIYDGIAQSITSNPILSGRPSSAEIQ